MSANFLMGVVDWVIGGSPGKQTLRRVLRGTSLTPVSAGDNWARFKLVYDGIQHHVSIGEDNGKFAIGVGSRAMFSLRAVTPVVQEFISKRNRDLIKCNWIVYDVENASWPIVASQYEFNVVNGKVFELEVEFLLREANFFDNELRRAGLL